MVRASVLGKQRMRKKYSKRTVPLDVVPERCTWRCSPRFRPGDHFCELRFRYQSSPTGIKGEISRPLDHMWQISFIHSARLITSSNFDIYNTVFWLFPPYGNNKCVLVLDIWQLHKRSCGNTNCKVLSHYSSHVVFDAVRAGAYRHKKLKSFTLAHCPLSRVYLFAFYSHLFFYYFKLPVSNYWYINTPFVAGP